MPTPTPTTTDDAHGMTYAEYCLLPDDGKRYELIEGALEVAAAPMTPHQRISMRLSGKLFAYVDERHLGEIFTAPTDILLGINTVVQPDVLFVSTERAAIITEKNIQGPPDLCIEILSPSTLLKDRYVKSVVYARHGVREYWIIDPDEQTVAVYTLSGGAFAAVQQAARTDTVHSSVVAGFALPVAALFA